MRVLITGICGFVGSSVAQSLLEHDSSLAIIGLDNLIRPGSETNRGLLSSRGVKFLHGDIRCPSDFEAIPPVDWVIDTAANPSVLAGIDGKTSSRQLIEHNLVGTVNMLEYCKRAGTGFILLSTSRVYSIPPLAALPVQVVDQAYSPQLDRTSLDGLSADGISEDFSTAPPASLYGTSKSASENLAIEYGDAFGFQVGSIVAACSPAPVNLAARIRESLPSGSTRICANGLSNTSALMEWGIRSVTVFIRAISRRCSGSK